MNLLHEINSAEWDTTYSEQVQSDAITEFENDKIVLLPQLTFQLAPNEKIFLSPEFSIEKSKNISFDSRTNQLRGAHCEGTVHDDLKGMLARYATSANTLITQLFPTYQHDIKLGRTSFRPVEILGRIPKSYRKDDTRIHVDAFPASPVQGKRIMRVFTNINPHGKERCWQVGESFDEVAKRFLPQISKPWPGRSFLLKALKITKGYCTDYDYLMLNIHDKMKADLSYQKNCLKQDIRFLPNSSWIVSTDSVSHAALSGQYVFEQTFYLPVQAMQQPALSPLKKLEKLTGRCLVSRS
jgi:hypothetical protein